MVLLLFIGATLRDSKFRTVDARCGRVLRKALLPYAGGASPVSYAVDGRQYVVIAASGSRDPKGPMGSAYVAYALPQRRWVGSSNPPPPGEGTDRAWHPPVLQRKPMSHCVGSFSSW